jgi:hypothetical protein
MNYCQLLILFYNKEKREKRKEKREKRKEKKVSYFLRKYVYMKILLKAKA